MCGKWRHRQQRNSPNANAPYQRMYVGARETGAAWSKRCVQSHYFLSLKLDALSFSANNVNLFADKLAEDYSSRRAAVRTG
jgi:uncharacterized protein (DUF736 family)